MDNLDSLIGYIKAKSETECMEIAQAAAVECKRVRAGYSKTEQDEYWKFIDAGSKETERRLERLNSLAGIEANKQILATQQEMVAKAFSLAALKIQELPEAEFAALIKRLRLKANSTAGEIVEKFEKLLSPTITAMLFD